MFKMISPTDLKQLIKDYKFTYEYVLVRYKLVVLVYTV